MNVLVKILVDDDGVEIDNPVWHLVDPTNHQGNAPLCTAEFFGGGESAVIFEAKRVKRGGITCPQCIEKIKTIKAIKL